MFFLFPFQYGTTALEYLPLYMSRKSHLIFQSNPAECSLMYHVCGFKSEQAFFITKCLYFPPDEPQTSREVRKAPTTDRSIKRVNGLDPRDSFFRELSGTDISVYSRIPADVLADEKGRNIVNDVVI